MSNRAMYLPRRLSKPVSPRRGGVEDTQNLLQRIDRAVKSFTMDDLGQAVLLPDQRNRFIRTIQDRSVALRQARFIDMVRHQMNIDRVGFFNRVLRAGRVAADNDKRELTESEFATPDFAMNQLNARELQAIAPLGDDTLYTNIEQGAFEGTLQDLFAEAAGRDLEEYAFLADSAIPYATDDVLHQTDGWVKRAGQKIYGVANTSGDAGPDRARDFNPVFSLPFVTEGFVDGTNQDLRNSNVEKMFQKMILATPKKYLQNRQNLRIFAPFEVHDAYHETLRSRNGQITSDPQTGMPVLYFKGIRVEEVPMLDRSRTTGAGGAGRVSLLADPSNMAWGVFRRVIVERDRLPKKRRTDFVLTVWADADYEDEGGATATFLDRFHP